MSWTPTGSYRKWRSTGSPFELKQLVIQTKPFSPCYETYTKYNMGMPSFTSNFFVLRSKKKTRKKKDSTHSTFCGLCRDGPSPRDRASPTGRLLGARCESEAACKIMGNAQSYMRSLASKADCILPSHYESGWYEKSNAGSDREQFIRTYATFSGEGKSGKEKKERRRENRLMTC